MNLSLRRKKDPERSNPPVSMDEWMSMFNFNGLSYPLQTYSGQPGEEIARNFQGYVQGAYRSNGVVFACMLVRLLLFSEARFQFRRMSNGRPGDLFGTNALSVLETPWSGGTTGDLLSRAIQDADLAGNFYATRRGDRIVRMRPDWVTIVLGSKTEKTTGDLDAEVIGYAYQQDGPHSGKPVVALLPENVCHFAPIPDPLAHFRGMSWLDPILREVTADQAMTTHRQKFFEQGATPNMVVSLDAGIAPDAFAEFVEKMDTQHQGYLDAYKTLYLAGGAKAEVVGKDLQQIDFKTVQGGGETRIAAAAGVPPVIVGLSEGLQAATYSNYGQARRRLSDGTMRPLWRNFAGSMARLIQVPSNAELWYDTRDIAFLQEDQKDAAEIQKLQAETIHTLIIAGMKPDTAVAAVMSGDFNKLAHSGLYSIQLQPAGTVAEGKGSALAGSVEAAPGEPALPKTNGSTPKGLPAPSSN
jgi:phage portal protein BeeE